MLSAGELSGRHAVSAGFKSRAGRRTGAGREVLCLAVAGAIILGGVALTSRSAAMTRVGYRISDLNRELAVLKNENEYLKAEVARWQSLERVQQVARERLGMRPPEEMRVLTVDKTWEVAMARKAAQSDGDRRTGRNIMTGGILQAIAKLASGARTAQAGSGR